MVLPFPQLPVRTGRLHLRSFAASDFVAYAAYHTRADVYRFLYAPAPTGTALEDQFSTVLSSDFSDDGHCLRLAVIRSEDEILLGEVLLKIASVAALQAEIGYIFNPDHAGRGYATEATGAMMAIGFDHFGFHRIFARLDALNAGSIGIVERLGLRKEAHLVQNDRFDGVWGDELIYAMLRSEWTARRLQSDGRQPKA